MKKILYLCVALLLGAGPLQAAPTAPNILVVGDSLSAAYGLTREQGWVALLDDKLKREGYPHTLVNASISGETTSGGLRRLPKLLQKHTPQIVIIELGGNDGLRALPVDAMRDNLRTMVEKSQAAGAQTLLLGMRIPSNYGPAYTNKFSQSFATVAEAQDATLVEFFLEPIALQETYFQSDRIHPNAKAQPLLLDHVWPGLKPLLDSD